MIFFTLLKLSSKSLFIFAKSILFFNYKYNNPDVSQSNIYNTNYNNNAIKLC